MNSIGYMMGLGVCLALPLGLTSGDCGKIDAACTASPVSLVKAACGAEPVSLAKAACDAEPVSLAKAACDAEPVSLAKAACGAEPVSDVAKATECCAAKAACDAEPVSLAKAACGAEPVSGVAKATECCAAKAACDAEPVSLAKAACGAEPVSGVATGEVCPAGEGAKLAVAQYKVKGMSCGACEGKLTGELKQVAGVSEPKACAQSGIAKLSYDAEKVKKEDLMAAIRRAGYTVVGEVVELKLEGVDCSGCTSQVSEALKATRGVKEHQVSHQEKRAVVTFDPATTCVDTVVAAIGRSGFKAVQ
jgi:copper chaperone CopZ